MKRYVKISKMRLNINSPRVFVPCSPVVRTEVEVDWGTTITTINGERKELKFFCMKSKYSGSHFAKFYPCERQQIFLDAHVSAFDFFGGISPVLIYDNLLIRWQNKRIKLRI